MDVLIGLNWASFVFFFKNKISIHRAMFGKLQKQEFYFKIVYTKLVSTPVQHILFFLILIYITQINFFRVNLIFVKF